MASSFLSPEPTLTLDVALLILRVLVGGLFVLHGYSKFTNFSAFYGWLNSTGMILPGFQARAALVAEVFAGILLITGLGGVLGPWLLIAIMLRAISIAHFQLNPLITEGGWEYCAVLIAVNLVLIAGGFGHYVVF